VGCFRRLGCLVFLALSVGVAWVTSDRWRPLLPTWVPGTLAPKAIINAPDSAWAPVTAAGATRAERSLAALGDRSAMVFTALHPAEFAGYVLMDLAGRLPPNGDSTQAAVIGNQLSIRTSLDIRALGGSDAWGPLAAVMGKRATLSFAGSFDIIRPGVAEFRVQQLWLHDLPVPGPLIPRVLRKVESGPHPTGLATNALLVNVPSYVADIRATGGRILIYKSVP
jgi:hypothetical protein